MTEGFPRWVPRWFALGWLRLSAQWRCGRCLACDRCREISYLERS
jgi:hypothetical protein